MREFTATESHRKTRWLSNSGCKSTENANMAELDRSPFVPKTLLAMLLRKRLESERFSGSGTTNASAQLTCTPGESSATRTLVGSGDLESRSCGQHITTVPYP